MASRPPGPRKVLLATLLLAGVASGVLVWAVSLREDGWKATDARAPAESVEGADLVAGARETDGVGPRLQGTPRSEQRPARGPVTVCVVDRRARRSRAFAWRRGTGRRSPTAILR